jgi:hypothetical protein
MVDVVSKRITINVPDDVAARLQHEENVSAYVTEAVRLRMRGESTRAILEAHGFRITDEGMQRWRERLAEGRAKMTPEFLARSREEWLRERGLDR